MGAFELAKAATDQFLFLCQHVCTLSAKLWKKTVCIAKDWFWRRRSL